MKIGFFYNACSVHIRKQRQEAEKMKQFHHESKRTPQTQNFARRVALLTTDSFPGGAEDDDDSVSPMAMAASRLQAKVKGAATAMERFKGLQSIATFKLEYKEDMKNIPKDTKKAASAASDEGGDPGSPRDRSAPRKRDTLETQAEESLKGSSKVRPNKVNAALTCPQSMALYILNKRLKSSQTSLDNQCKEIDRVKQGLQTPRGARASHSHLADKLRVSIKQEPVVHES